MLGRGQTTLDLLQVIEDRLLDQPVRRAVNRLRSLLKAITGCIIELYAKGGSGHWFVLYGLKHGKKSPKAICATSATNQGGCHRRRGAKNLARD